jgi:hypothetical protein
MLLEPSIAAADEADNDQERPIGGGSYKHAKSDEQRGNITNKETSAVPDPH